ncbi:MAG: acetyl-CoA C-acetyltransferase [Blastocatellia bacterium]|nr:acetyl-CoA C-acetyltransferase [Blastocatellia bacterium]
MKDAFILSGARTPVGKFQGSLSPFQAPELGSFAIRAAIERAGIDAAEIEEVIMGNVLQAGLGQNPARQAALKAGCANSVGAMTINKVCGSGLKAVALGAQAIMLGEAEVVVGGGMESMTNAPYLLPKARQGYRLGNGTLVDAIINDGLWCAIDNWHMGNTGEYVAETYGISREAQDEFAFNSHRKAAAAIEAGRFTDEIVQVAIPQKKGDPVMFATDESVRADTTVEALSKLRPAFTKDGTVTAGNAPGVNDGGAAVVVSTEAMAEKLGRTPMARIVAQATSGMEPKLVMMAPVEAVRKVLAKTGWQRGDVELIELNEAFSVQALAVTRELELDPERVNVNGGAVAIGHPIGASGARVLVTLLFEMQRRNARRGIAALCLGGGNAVAMAVER